MELRLLRLGATEIVLHLLELGLRLKRKSAKAFKKARRRNGRTDRCFAFEQRSLVGLELVGLALGDLESILGSGKAVLERFELVAEGHDRLPFWDGLDVGLAPTAKERFSL